MNRDILLWIIVWQHESLISMSGCLSKCHIYHHLVTLPLWGSHTHRLLDGGLRELGSELGQVTLVGGKAGAEAGESRHLAGETDCVARHIHKLARSTRLLTHSEDTLLLHGLGEATQEVLAET